jgi:hypothetical protein
MPFLRPLLVGLSNLADAFGLSGDAAKKGQEDISNPLISLQGSTAISMTNIQNAVGAASMELAKI